MIASAEDATALLQAWTAGDVAARDRVVSVVYRDLRQRAAPPIDVDVLDLDAALTRLDAFDSRKCQLAELRFFGGLSLEEAGQALGISLATAERDWQAARAWLFKELRGR